MLRKSLFIAIAMAANVSMARHEHVYYTCNIEGSFVTVVSFHFNREWKARGDSLEVPSFNTTAIIDLPGMDSSSGVASGKLIGGHTRLTGSTDIYVATNSETLKLWLIETDNRAFGTGSHLGQEIFLTCAVAVEADQSVEAFTN